MSQTEAEQIHAAVSYSRNDTERVEPLLDALKASGIAVWFDKDIPGGALWEEIIARKYRASGALLFFLSRSSLESQRCSEEVSTARTLGKPIIPILLDPLKLPDDLPDRFVLTLQARNTVDALNRSHEEALAAILKALEGFGIRPGAALPRAAAPKPAPAPARAPAPVPAAAPRTGSKLPWIVAGVALILVAAGAFVMFRGAAPAPAPVSVPVAEAPPVSAAAAVAATPSAAQPQASTVQAATPQVAASAAQGAAGSGEPRIVLEKPGYPVGVPIRLRVSGLPGNARDTVTLAEAGSAPEAYVRYIETGGAIEKTLTLPSVMKAGAYEARLFFGSPAATEPVRFSAPFEVTPAEPVSLALAKPGYMEGERIEVSYSGMPGNQRDWLTVVKDDAAEGAYLHYEYTNGLAAGKITFRPVMQAGHYEVRAHFDDSTSDKTVRARIPLEIAPAPAPEASLDAASYAPGAKITVSYSGMPGNERDWFSVAAAGSADSAYLSYQYTAGRTEGTVTLNAPAEAGRYEVRGYFDDSSGDRTVRARLTFEVPAGG